jgi:hypothetical protein
VVLDAWNKVLAMSKYSFSLRVGRVVKRMWREGLQRLLTPQQFWALRHVATLRSSLRWEDRWLCLGSATPLTSFYLSYVFHTARAYRILAESRLAQHINIFRPLYFVYVASAFVSTRFYDHCSAQLGLSGLAYDQADLTWLHSANRSIESLSSMHVGLARYGCFLLRKVKA